MIGFAADVRWDSARFCAFRNMLHYGDLSFRDFMEVAMYHPESGYYARGHNPVGRSGDYVTSPLLSPAFSFALGGLIREF